MELNQDVNYVILDISQMDLDNVNDVPKDQFPPIMDLKNVLFVNVEQDQTFNELTVISVFLVNFLPLDSVNHVQWVKYQLDLDNVNVLIVE
jgi:hypothetical protein